MKKHIAKLIVFLMLMTTIVVPADLSFAEAANENVTAAEEEQLEETVTEEMEFLYIESKELTAPGTQNIVVSWKESIDDIEEMILVYENEQGQAFTLKESKRNDESIVFTKDFTVSEAGTYKIKGVKYFVGTEEKYFAFDDVEIAASFEVTKGETTVNDAVATVEVESNGSVDKTEASRDIKDAVESTEAAAAAQSNTASTESDNVIVVLDPGHGGSDSGATRGSVYEKTINLKVAQYCKAELEQYYGVTVYMTRSGDTNPSLKERAQIAANYGADILVSIHQNAQKVGSTSAYGAEVYYPNKNYKPAIGNSGKTVADAVQAELVSLGLSNRGTKIRNTANGSTYADGSYADYYGIIRESKKLSVPAIIVEHAYLSNTSDYNNFLSSDSKLQKLGVADATGIAKAFGLSKGKWVQDENGWKYQYGNNQFKTNEFCSINGYTYYFDENGYRAVGFKEINGNKYYFYSDGKAKAGWVSTGGKKYYSRKDGSLYKGLNYVGAYRYYFDPETRVMQTGDVMINGTMYHFDKNGRWIK